MSDAPGRIRLVGGRVFTGVDGSFRDDLEVETGTDGRLAYVGPSRASSDDPDVRVLDVTGRCVFPGFIDCHVHLSAGGGEPLQTWATLPRSYRYLRVAGALGRILDAGVTTVRDMGGVDYGVKAAVDDDLLPGPRILGAIALITPTGGHADTLTPAGFDIGDAWFLGSEDLPMGLIADTEDQIRVAVRRLARAGADLAKLSVTGGPGPFGPTPDQVCFTRRDIEVAIREAEAQGLSHVAVHAMGQAGIGEAIDAGARTIEHGWDIRPEHVARMREGEQWLVPTLSGAARFRGAPSPASLRDDAPKAWGDVAFARVTDAIANGVAIAMGTDGAPPGENLGELHLLTTCGLTPEQALLSATRDAAAAIGLADEIGTLEPGKRADVVVTDGRVAQDLALLADAGHVDLVLRDGRVRKSAL